MIKFEIDDVLKQYNNSGDECPAEDPNRTTLEFGAYTIEEFIWWLKKNDYKFTKENSLPMDLEDTLLKCWVVFETPDLDEKRKG